MCLIPTSTKFQAEKYTGGRNFGHLAYAVDNIYETCEMFQKAGVVINRPPRDGILICLTHQLIIGKMAFVRSPDGISIELLQKGDPLELAEPWKSMASTGEW